MNVKIEVDSNDIGKQIETEIKERLIKNFEFEQTKLFTELNSLFYEKVENLIKSLTCNFKPEIAEKLKKQATVSLSKWFKGVENERRKKD